MKYKLFTSIIFLGVQFLLWKGVSLIPDITQKTSNHQESQKESNTLQTTLKGHALKVTSVAITSDNKTVISGSEDNTIKIWDSITGQLKLTLTGHTGSVNYLSVTSDRNYLVSAENKSARIWNLQTGTLIRELKNANDYINFIEISPDKQSLIIDGGTQLFKNTETKVIGNSTLSTSEVTKYTVSIYELKTGSLKSQLAHDKQISQIKISQSGNILASAETSGNINIWSLKSSTLQRTLVGHESEIQSIAISPDEKTIVSTDKDGIIKFWNLASGNIKTTFKGHNNQSYESVKALIPDNNTVATWSKKSILENDIKIWNLQTGELKYTIKPTKKSDSSSFNYFNSVTLSTDSKNLILQGESGIQTWELATGQLKNTITIPNTFLAISPNGQVITTGDENNTINIWQTPKQI